MSNDDDSYTNSLFTAGVLHILVSLVLLAGFSNEYQLAIAICRASLWYGITLLLTYALAYRYYYLTPINESPRYDLYVLYTAGLMLSVYVMIYAFMDISRISEMARNLKQINV